MKITRVRVGELALIAALSLFPSLSATARTWPLRFEDAKVATIAFPDSWQVSQSMEFIDGWSPDKAAHIVVSVVPLKQAAATSSPHRVGPEGTDIDALFGQLGSDEETDQLLSGLTDDFKDDQVTIDPSTKKARGGKRLGGIKGATYEGTREGKSVDAGTGVITLAKSHKAVLFTYWTLKENETERRQAIAQVIGSIRED